MVSGMPTGANWLTKRWQNAAQPLHMALFFQAVIFVLIVVDVPFPATAFVGGTTGCVIAALRLQKSTR